MDIVSSPYRYSRTREYSSYSILVLWIFGYLILSLGLSVKSGFIFKVGRCVFRFIVVLCLGSS